MKKFISTSFLLIGLLLVASCGNSGKGNASADAAQADTAKGKYICPMDTDVVSDHAGTCKKCGMELEKVG